MNADEFQQQLEQREIMEQTRPPQVYAAITKVMAAIGKAGIAKDRKNTQQNYQFRGIDDVYNALSPILADAQLCILPRSRGRNVTERETKSGGVLFNVSLDVDYDIVCAIDGSIHTVTVPGEAMDSGDKATNKAMSAAYKYACMQIFCIPTEGDNDADSTTHDVAAKKTPEVHGDVWAALGDSANLGKDALKKTWQGLTKETRAAITEHYHGKWETLKSTAAGVSTQAEAA